MVLTRFIKWMILSTSLAVVYIHMQMQIIQLAYIGKAKEKHIKKLIEQNDNLIHDILMVKSSSNLGTEMLSEKTKMQFAGPENIVKLQAPKGLLTEDKLVAQKQSQSYSDRILDFLSLGRHTEVLSER